MFSIGKYLCDTETVKFVILSIAVFCFSWPVGRSEIFSFTVNYGNRYFVINGFTILYS